MHTDTRTERDTPPHGAPVTGALGTGAPGSGESRGPDPASARWQAPGVEPGDTAARPPTADPGHAAAPGPGEARGLGDAPGLGEASGPGGGAAPGLVGTLESLLETMQHTLGIAPWSLSETDIGHALGQAQQLRALADTLTAVLAGEADTRGLGTTQGLSRPDWLRTVAPHLDPATAPALARVAAAMHPGEPRWAALATGVRTGRVSTSQAALILRFHDDLARVADPEHLRDITTAMTDSCDVLSVRELGRLAAHARASLKPPAELDADDTGMRLGRALTRIRSTTAYTEYRLRLDPEGAAILDAAIDPLARPRPDHHCTQPTTARTPTSTASAHSADSADNADSTDGAPRDTSTPRDTGTAGEPGPGDGRTGHAFARQFGDGSGGGTGDGSGTVSGTSSRDGSGSGSGSDSGPGSGHAPAGHGPGQGDPRTASTRRADALLELIGRAVAAPPRRHPHPPHPAGHHHHPASPTRPTPRRRDLRQRRHPVPRHRPPPRLRSRDHPHHPRRTLGNPGPGPHRTPLHPRPTPRPGPPRPRLLLPRLHHPTPMDRSPPHHPLGRWRPHQPDQRRPPLRPPPHPRAPTQPHRHHHPNQRHLAPIAAPPHTPLIAGGAPGTPNGMPTP
ncbi:hypothetical protein GCM10027053_17610 [Intrasporangium mesophilum]